MITTEPFGHVHGQPARAFGISDGGSVSLRLTDYGARLTELHVPGSDGTTADVVLGFDDAQSYVESPAYFGATVGRFGNRITRGRFTLLGSDHQVDVNEKNNHLHGGRHGWDSRIWDVDTVDPASSSITFRTSSADGEMGFPGSCTVRSTYSLSGERLRITMEAVPDATTVINMVHHSYFNLAGHGMGDVLAQRMRLAGDFYIPVDSELMPTGEVLAVAGTPYDFRDAHPIGQYLHDLPAVGADVFEGGGGWDHNWCLGIPDSRGLIEAADIVDPGSGRRIRLWSTEPGLQMYTGGYLDESIIGKGGVPYCQYAGFTLETQKFPDSPNFGHFPSTTVGAGDTYRQVMEFDFTPV
ncbi:aldose epimerase family protein [Kineosporia sp. A_224]|uniref:aldose epimerase family protein n=1 Tax=Kineosporia sp. A_224 TaxID=1962180 RepID=UPI000B4B3571|nr:aldose epimerase family protein [Kineosporia sp. A_224]